MSSRSLVGQLNVSLVDTSINTRMVFFVRACVDVVNEKLSIGEIIIPTEYPDTIPTQLQTGVCGQGSRLSPVVRNKFLLQLDVPKAMVYQTWSTDRRS